MNFSKILIFINFISQQKNKGILLKKTEEQRKKKELDDLIFLNVNNEKVEYDYLINHIIL